MAMFDDEEEHEGSDSDIDNGEPTADGYLSEEPDPDVDAEGEEEDENEDLDEDEDQDEGPDDTVTASRFEDGEAEAVHSSAGKPTTPRPPEASFLSTPPSPRRSSKTPEIFQIPRPSVRLEALTASVYDIIPTIAAPHSTSINCITATPDMRWVFSGGADGYVRKFNWPDTVNSKSMLTVAQRHPFVDSVTKHGVLMSYWDNEEWTGKPGDGAELSPVHSLAVQYEGLWLMSGLESGSIVLTSVRHGEGSRITSLQGHNSAVSVLAMAKDERSCLSGSWDKTINDWDLETGKVKRKFASSAGQISAIEPRPQSSLPIPEQSMDLPKPEDTFSSNNATKPSQNGIGMNGISRPEQHVARDEEKDADGSPGNSLFDSNGDDHNSLFGEDLDINGVTSAGEFNVDADDEFSKAIADGLQQTQDADAEGDIDMQDYGGPVQEPQTNIVNGEDAYSAQPTTQEQMQAASSQPRINGLPHSDEPSTPNNLSEFPSLAQPLSSSSSTNTFLDASIDGSLRIWDDRSPNPVAHIAPPRSAPPWCMNACWSPDGNFIYAGRRNGTVDEYSFHHNLSAPIRSFRFPAGSGPVSAVKAMPNGKHLICASHDILRLYDLTEREGKGRSAVPFLIVPGHRTGVVSQLFLDPTCRYLISTGGNRGWEGTTTEVLLGYEIGVGS